MTITIINSFHFPFTVDPEPTTTLPPTNTTSPVTNTPQWLAPIDCNGLPSGPAYSIGNRRYDYGPRYLTWAQARSHCHGRGGDLAVTGMDSLATRK